MSHTTHAERAAEVIAALMKAPRTTEELCNAIGLDILSGSARRRVMNWVRATGGQAWSASRATAP